MAKHTLRRDGQPPLAFEGELLAEADGERVGGQERNRWHELAVFRTAGGKFVVRIGYRTRWQGEHDRDRADILATASAVASMLTEYDPCSVVRGYPPGRGYEDRQQHLLRAIREDYQALVSEVLSAHPEFAEVIE